MQTKLLATAVVLATLFPPSLAGITTATAQGQAGGARLTPPPGGAMFAPSKAKTITFRQNGVLLGTFAVGACLRHARTCDVDRRPVAVRPLM